MKIATVVLLLGIAIVVAQQDDIDEENQDKTRGAEVEENKREQRKHIQK